MKETFDTYTPNEIVLCKTDFNNSHDELMTVLAQQLYILLKSKNVVVISLDDYDNILINFEHDEGREIWGCRCPVWLSEKEEVLLRNTINKE